jgi:hypothetical protein
MKRMTLCSVAATVIFLALPATRAPSQDPTPPGPGDEWRQEDWTSIPPRRNRPMAFGGGMRGQGPMFGPAEFQQHMQEMQSRIFGMQNHFQDMQRLAEVSKNNAIRQSLGVNDQQWARLKPTLDRIERLKTEANASIDPGSFGGGPSFVSGGGNFGGGWAGGFSTFGSSGQPGQNWSHYETFGPGGSRSTRGRSGEPTQGGALCEELYNLLQVPGTPPAQISRKIAALRQAKQRAQKELAQERTQLRSLVNPHQEAALIVMGYLD